MTERKRPQYKRIESTACTVHVIEVITENDNLCEVTELLEHLQQYSAAGVVDSYLIAGTLDHNSTILEKRQTPK